MTKNELLHLKTEVLVNNCLLLAFARAMHKLPGVRGKFIELAAQVIENAPSDDAEAAATACLEEVLQAVWGPTTPVAS
ncbi:MAG: hypothetical protein WC809_18665 [Sinimarinibacterium sp.]